MSEIAEASAKAGFTPAELVESAGRLTRVEFVTGAYSGIPENEARTILLTYERDGQSLGLSTTALFRLRAGGVWSFEPVPEMMVLSAAAQQPGTRVVPLAEGREAICLDEVLVGGSRQVRCHLLYNGKQVVLAGGDAQQVESTL